MVSLNYSNNNGPVLKTFQFQYKIKVIDRSFGNLLPLHSQNVGLGTFSNTTSSIALKVLPLFG